VSGFRGLHLVGNRFKVNGVRPLAHGIQQMAKGLAAVPAGIPGLIELLFSF
jgi:hypothetical protein